MECTGQTCDQMCDARWCILKRIHSLNSGSGQQACNGGVQSQCDMRCHTVSNCKQHCNPQTCNMTCRGEECNQNCISEEQGCIMQCMGSSCTRTCDAYTCEMTRRGSSNSYTKQVCTSGNGWCCQRILVKESMGHFETTCQGREHCTYPKCLNRDYMTLSKSNVTAAVSASAVQTISTHISTE